MLHFVVFGFLLHAASTGPTRAPADTSIGSPPADSSAAPAQAGAGSLALDSAVVHPFAPEGEPLAGVVRHAGEGTDTLHARTHALELSDWYYRRLLVHRIASYTELPLFAAEYWLGNELLTGHNIPAYVQPTHVVVAGGLAALFSINTLTGGWNLLESWPPPDHKALIVTHTALMLGADLGFAITGVLAGGAKHHINIADQHRTAALISIGTATVGTGIMWLWDR